MKVLKNNNQEAVKRIGIRSMKQNKARNIFAVIAIILTAFMFTSVFSIGFSLAKNMNTMLKSAMGSDADLYFTHPTPEQIEQAKSCKSLKHGGIYIRTAIGNLWNNNDVTIQLCYSDDENFQYIIKPAIIDVKGNYPQKENEIMLSVNGLEAANIKEPKIGDNIKLNVNGVEKDFQLSGYFRDYAFRTNAYTAYISKSFADSIGESVESGMYCMTAKKFQLSALKRQLFEKISLSEDQGIQVIGTDLDGNITVAAIVLFICLIIIVSGYLLIYNIMYISVSRDIRFYGMLKTIGTTSGQIRKIVKIQAYRLSGLGIVIGAVLGALTSLAAVPYAMKFYQGGINGASDVLPSSISFNPLIYLLTAVFAFMTVSLSCRKPAKLAGKVSPIEAVKYNGQMSNKIKPKKTTDGGKLYKTAFRNVFREKKRAFLVFASMLMGTLALLTAHTFIGCVKLDNYAERYIPDDYAVYPYSTSDKDYRIIDKNKIEAAQKLADNIKSLNGVTNVMLNRSVKMNLAFDKELFMTFLEVQKKYYDYSIDDLIKTYEEHPEEFIVKVTGIDRAMLERHNKTAKQKIDVDAFERGEVCFVGTANNSEECKLLKGKTITIVSPDTGKRRDIEVGVFSEWSDDNGFVLNHETYAVGAPEFILVSQSVIDELTDTPFIDVITADCKPDNESAITNKIKELTNNNICIPSVAHVEIKSEILRDFNTSMNAFNLLVSGVSIILILIGVINFVNVMLTGIFNRRRELAVMESIGMTKSQIKKMLMLEGVYYGVITAALIFGLGGTICKIISVKSVSIIDYAVPYFPLNLMLIITAVILTVCIAVPAAVYMQISKESVTERLR